MIFEIIMFVVSLVATPLQIGSAVKRYKSGNYYLAAVFTTLALYFATLIVSFAWWLGAMYFGI